MSLSILEEAVFNIGNDISGYDSIEKDIDTIVFALEKAHNKNPMDFQALVECLKTKGRRRNTKKRCTNGPGNFSRIKIVRTQFFSSAHS